MLYVATHNSLKAPQRVYNYEGVTVYQHLTDKYELSQRKSSILRITVITNDLQNTYSDLELVPFCQTRDQVTLNARLPIGWAWVISLSL